MFEAIKTANGPSIRTGGVLKKKDGTVIEDQDKKCNRWIEHYSERYGTEGTADHAYINKLPSTATDHSLDEHPDSDEIIRIAQRDASQKMTQSGKHGIFRGIFWKVLKLIPNCSKWSKYTHP